MKTLYVRQAYVFDIGLSEFFDTAEGIALLLKHPFIYYMTNDGCFAYI